MNPHFVVVGGVSGTGKTIIARTLATLLEWKEMDADFFHSPKARKRMSDGIPLTSEYRHHWLGKVKAGLLTANHLGVSCAVACSLLKREFREKMLRTLPGQISIVWLEVPEAEIRSRVTERFQKKEHWFPPELVSDQIKTATQWRGDRQYVGPVPGEEKDVYIVDASGTDEIAKALRIIEMVPALGAAYRELQARKSQ